MGLDTLLEMILLQADVLELKANPNKAGKRYHHRGISLIKAEAQLRRFLCRTVRLSWGIRLLPVRPYGRVRAMMDHRGNRVETALPSEPIGVLGFSEVPDAGDILNVVEVDKLSRQVAEETPRPSEG